MKEEKSDVENDEIGMSRSTKEKEKRVERCERNEESQVIRTENKDDDLGKVKTKENGNEDVTGNGEGLSKANRSRPVAKTYNRKFHDKKAARQTVEQERTCSAEVYDAHGKRTTYSDVPQPQDDNEVKIAEIRMAKDVFCEDGIGRGMMEVTQQVKFEVDEVVELPNEEVRCKRWQVAMIDEHVDEATEERSYGDMEGLKERARNGEGRR